MPSYNVGGIMYDAPNYAEARRQHLAANPSQQKNRAQNPLPASTTPDLKSILAKKVQDRENRVLVQRNLSLDFTMKSGSSITTFKDPLRFNLRKTGFGRQDAEILVTLPIFVHTGGAAKTYWSKKYAANLFDVTAHPHPVTKAQAPGVTGAAAGADVLKRWSSVIDDWWGDAAVIHHPATGEQTYYRLKFEFSFTDDPAKACREICAVSTSGQAAEVNPSGTIDAVRWGVNDLGPGGPICHEVGHFIGCPDEYFTITYKGKTKPWGGGYQANMGVMNNPNEKPLARHYRVMGQELAGQFGFNPDESSVVLNVTKLLNNPTQKRHALSGHIWDGL